MDSEKHPAHRKRLRLQNYDYGETGPYFITVALQARTPLFSSIHHGTVHLSEVGQLIEDAWLALETRFDGLELDDYVIMPDHIHGIVSLPIDGSTKLGSVLQAFKSITTVDYGRGVASLGWPKYEKRLWQRDYWEHIVRNDRDLEEKRRYIQGNPASWNEKRG